MDGLLPHAAQRSRGRRGFVTVPDAGVDSQLVALCAFRRLTKSWDRLAIHLWVDGWRIEPERLRRAVLRGLPTIDRPRRWTVRRQDDLGSTANALAHGLARSLDLGTTDAETADGLEVLLRVAFGVDRSVDGDAARRLRRVSGEALRASEDTIDGAGPWLAEPPPAAGLRLMVSLFADERLRALVADASDAELLAVRDRARLLLHDLPEHIRWIELVCGHNKLGLHGVLLARRLPAAAVVLALHFTACGLGKAIDLHLQSLDAQRSERQRGIKILEAYRQLRPQHGLVMRASGMQGLVERGLLDPLTTAELEAAGL
jgi:hypothetical protein